MFFFILPTLKTIYVIGVNLEGPEGLLPPQKKKIKKQ